MMVPAANLTTTRTIIQQHQQPHPIQQQQHQQQQQHIIMQQQQQQQQPQQPRQTFIQAQPQQILRQVCKYLLLVLFYDFILFSFKV